MFSWEVRGRQPARAQRGSQAAFQEAPARRRLLGGLLVARALHALRLHVPGAAQQRVLLPCHLVRGRVRVRVKVRDRVRVRARVRARVGVILGCTSSTSHSMARTAGGCAVPT